MDSNFYNSYFKSEKEHWWFRVRRNLILDLLQKYSVSKTAKIFDFGCGSGYTVGYLQEQGYDASGSDISVEAIKFGLGQGIRNLAVVKDHEIKPPEGGFDVILALDVIEHIDGDYEAIRNIEKALRPGGIIVMTVPAYQWLWGVQDEISHHRRRYTIESLVKIFRTSPRLRILRTSYFNTFLFLPIVIVRIFSKWFNLKGRESDFDINSKWVNRLLFFIFNLESKFLRFMNMPFGISILLVAKNENK